MLTTYERLVEDYQFSDIFVKWSFLAGVSACLERRCWVDRNALGYVYPNMYVMLVGAPATFKTTTAKVVIDTFLKTLPEEARPIMCANQITPAALIKRLKDAEGHPRLMSHGCSPLFVFSGEFQVFLNDIGGGSVISLLLDMFDKRRPGELWKKDTVMHSEEAMKNPALTVLGCTTNEHLAESKLLKLAGTGFTSRFIIVHEPRRSVGTDIFPALQPVTVQRMQQEFQRIMQIAGPFKLTSHADLELSRIIRNGRKWVNENPGGILMESYMIRKWEQVLKVAMCLSAMRSNDRTVTDEDVKRGEALMTELEPELTEAFGMQIIYNDPSLANKILQKIKRGDRVKHSELKKAFEHSGQHVPADKQFDGVIRGLMESKLLRIETDGNELVYVRER